MQKIASGAWKEKSSRQWDISVDDSNRILMQGIDFKVPRVAVGTWIGNGWETHWFGESATDISAVKTGY